jgi:hypothetical protein
MTTFQGVRLGQAKAPCVAWEFLGFSGSKWARSLRWLKTGGYDLYCCIGPRLLRACMHALQQSPNATLFHDTRTLRYKV